MAHETKAQRMERLEVEHAAQVAADAAVYVQRLAAVLESAQDVGFQVKVKDRKLCVTGMENYSDVVLGMYHTEDHQSALEDLLYYVKYECDARMRTAFREQLRAAALAKLTKEERALLGL